MMVYGKLLLAAMAALFLGGCAVQSKYAWGSYEPSLYSHYKNPAQMDAFAEALAKTIGDAEAKGQKLAPGIYAEYGHVLQQQGKLTEAATYYRKEKNAWPEAATFMDTMIKSVEAAEKKNQNMDKNKS
jgi:hypothetical protein